MDEYIIGFIDYLKNQKSASVNTVQAYQSDLTQYMEYMKYMGIAHPESVDKSVLVNYTKFLFKKGRSESTVSRCVASIRCFYRYLIIEGIAKANPATGIKLNHEQKRLPEILTNEEVDLLLKQPSNDDFKGYRDKAMLEVLYATGIRVSELVALNVSDINIELGVLCCHSDSKSRIIPIYQEAVNAVIFYLSKSVGFLEGTDRSIIC